MDLGWAYEDQTRFTLAVHPPPLTGIHSIESAVFEILLAVSPRNGDAQHFKLTLSHQPWTLSDREAWKKVRVTKLERTKPPR